jgi:hypothetical protein
MMMMQADKQSYLGVRCLSCRQPIPVPSILASRVSGADREDSLLFTEQHDRVFSLRCRACEREKPYRVSDVVEFEGTPVARLSRVRSHGHSSRSDGLARSANA